MLAQVVSIAIAFVSALVAGFSAYVAYGSRKEAKRSREISQEALENARTSTAMAASSAKTALETRHDAIAPEFDVKSKYNDQLDVVWVRVELIKAPAPLQIEVRVDGTLYCSDGGAYGAEAEIDKASFFPRDDFDFPVSHPAGLRPEGLDTPVTIRSIRKRDRWDDPNVVPWEWSEHIRWGWDPTRDP